MKKLLLVSSLVVGVFLFYACQQKAGSKAVKEEMKMEGAKPDGKGQSIEGVKTGDINENGEAKKETETEKKTGQVVNHGDPDQAKLDSLVEAKTKSKIKKKNGGN